MAGTSSQYVRAGIIVLILALGAGNLYQFITNRKLQQVNEDQKKELLETIKLNSELESQYNEAKSELEDLKGVNEELNARIDNYIEELEKKKEQIKFLLRSRRSLKKARKEIEELKNQIRQYIEEIEALQKQNELLQEENLQLKETTVRLEHTIRQKDSIQEVLLTEKRHLEEEKEMLSQEKEDILIRYNRAAAIPVEKIKVKGYKDKGGGKGVRRWWAKNIDYLKICIRSGVNENSSQGKEVYYVRLFDPHGHILRIEGSSGTFTDYKSGEEIPYSYAQEWNYKGQKDENCVIWQPGDPFAKGTYRIEVYNKGYKVAERTFRLL